MLSLDSLSQYLRTFSFAALKTRIRRYLWSSGRRFCAITTRPKCAAALNLNAGFLHFPTAKELYAHIRSISHDPTDKEFVVRNFVGVIEDVSVAACTVETELFPLGALEYYTKKNMGWDYSDAERDMWQLAERGGEQGDYRAGIKKKIDNVIACLKAEPLSKRATITFPFTGIEAGGTGGSETNDWTYQGQNKCCRELHLYLEDGKLKCTAIVRMQNANIFVKNIHFFATLLEYVARELDVPLGEYTHWYVSHGGWGLPRAHAVRCHSLCFPSHNAPQSSPPGPGPVPTP